MDRFACLWNQISDTDLKSKKMFTSFYTSHVSYLFLDSIMKNKDIYHVYIGEKNHTTNVREKKRKM